MKKLLFLFIVFLLIISCYKKPDLAYKDACAHPDALKEIKYYVKHKNADADGLMIAAAKNPNEKIVKELLRSKIIDSNQKLEALLESLENNNIEVFKVLLRNTDGINYYINFNRETILMRAYAKGRLDIVDELIKAGADINASDNSGNTILHLVCMESKTNKEIVEKLINGGADINAKNNDGMTPLMFACASGDPVLVDVLIAAGADVNAKNMNGATALALEIEFDRSTGINNKLRESGADMQEVYKYFEIKMVPIPGKNFEMLSTEVSQKTYSMVIGKNPSEFNGEKLPVECVNWYDAVEFCNELSRKFGFTPVYNINKNTVTQNISADGFRLPTSEEWVYSAKGGKNYTYSGSNKIDPVGWCWNNSGRRTHIGAQKIANGYGLYDMSGNVWEWCWDAKQSDRLYRSVHGGGWRNGASDCEVSSMDWAYAYDAGVILGFRIVRNLK